MALFTASNAQTNNANSNQEIGKHKASMISVNAKDFTGKSSAEIISSILELSSDYSFVAMKEPKRDKLGKSHQKFNQYYKGIQVAMGQIIAHYNVEGTIELINGIYYSIDVVNLSATIDATTALNSAVEKLGIITPMWEDEETSSFANYEKPEGELVILPNFDNTSEFNLAWKFDVFAAAPQSIRGITYVDAQTSEILFYNAIIKHANNFGHGSKKASSNDNCEEITSENISFMPAAGDADTKYSGNNQQVETTLQGGVYSLASFPSGVQIATFDAHNAAANDASTATIITDPNNNNDWTSSEFTGKTQGELDAHWGAEEVYDYWDQVHGRNSFNDSGAAINSLVHVQTNYDNAFWNGSWMSYGDGSSNGNEGNGNFDILTSLDVCAHEIGHAVMTNTADLVYQREPGAMNEGFSDIWAAANEFWTKGNGNEFNPNNEVWLIGDEIDRRSGSVGLRSMSNPNVKSQPDTYGGAFWINPNCGTPTQFNDYCGVHTNSGVLNYWFYLSVVGGSGTNDVGDNFSVNGIGMGDAELIALRMQDVYLTTNSDFADARTAAIQSAIDLFGACSTQVETVTNAMYAVGVGNEFNNVTEYTGSWSNGLPADGKVVTISSNYNSASNGGSITACAITVSSGATLTIAAGDFLNITNDIVVDGNLVVEHEGSVVQTDDASIATNNGTITVQKTTPNLGGKDFMILGSPMSAESRTGVYGAGRRVLNHRTDLFVPNGAVGGGTENFVDDNNNNWEIHDIGLTLGAGYLVKPQAPGNPPVGGQFTLDYTLGTLNNGLVTYDLMYNGSRLSSPNMLGNPYASAIDLDVFLPANPLIDAVYYWQHITAPVTTFPGFNQLNFNLGDISVYNQGSGGVEAQNGGGIPTRYMASGQGFGVKALGLGQATFNNSMRVTGPNTDYRQSNNDRQRIWLDLKSEAYDYISSNMLVAFTDGATDGFENEYDSKRFDTPISLFSVLATDEELAIQGRTAFNEEQEVQLGFSTMVEEATTYSISIRQLEGEDISNATVYLHDKVLNVNTNLSEANYVFTSNVTYNTNRFDLIFKEKVLSNNDVALQNISMLPNPTSGMLTVNSPNADIHQIEVIDLQGRVVSLKQYNNSNQYLVDLSSLGTAMYFVKIYTSEGTLIKRVIRK